MQTFYVDKNAVNGDILTPDQEVAHHLTKVLRMNIGEEVRFSDREKYYYEGQIATMRKSAVSVSVTKRYEIDDEPRLAVTLIQCLPRGDKSEQILQKTTELGIKRVIFAESDHCQLRLKNKKEDKQRRWQKIADAAAEQCGRGFAPLVFAVASLKEAVAEIETDTEIIFCNERENKIGLKQILTELKSKTKKIAVVIGPEGGFSEAEAEYIISRGGRSITLGKRILRTETAGPAVLAAMMYEFSEWEATP